MLLTTGTPFVFFKNINSNCIIIFVNLKIFLIKVKLIETGVVSVAQINKRASEV